MVTLWIGDFRAKQLQTLYKAAQQTAEYHYLVDDLAEYSWFINNAISQIPTMSLESANVVIALGFNDCVYSCVWDSFKADRIAKQYATAINDLKTEYPNFNVYVCSVNPIDAGYPFAESTIGLITQKQLTEKIKLFNNALKKDCKAEYIDSYKYLTDTGFTTRDGIRYVPDTCNILHNYITTHFASLAAATFSPRISAPDQGVDSYTYWMSATDGGENPFTMPSCAAYAWGRFYEIIGELPKLSHADSEYWYGYTTDGYKRGDTPRVGAIACWQNGAPGGSDYGYVAIVEQVKDDGSIITSEIDSNKAWKLITRTKGSGNWGMTGTYHFQGFIYCPFTASVSKEDICTKNSYDISIDEMKPNAQYIYSHLSAKGWTLNAVAGMLGNVQVESKMSPWAWQGTIEGSIINADGTHSLNTALLAGKSPGYGLVQWTPYSKYVNWCTTKGLDYWDIDSQLQRIDWEVENGDQWIARPSKGYDLTFNDFIASTRDSAWLAEAFAFCYERPGSSTGTEAQQNALRAERGANGDFWYNYLSTLSLDAVTTQLKINNFKLDFCSETQAAISFLVNDGVTVKYSLLKGTKNIKTASVAVKTGSKVITFNNLVPDTDYIFNASFKDIENNVIERSISFRTSQDYPQSPEAVKLSKDTKNNFNLNIDKPKHLGYWKSSSGYDIDLIIDNMVIKTISVDNASKDVIWKTFSLKDKFKYTQKIDDLIQIGVRTWVKTSSGQKLYADLKCSQPVCLLTKSVRLGLNK